MAPYSAQFQVAKRGPQIWLVIGASGVFYLRNNASGEVAGVGWDGWGRLGRMVGGWVGWLGGVGWDSEGMVRGWVGWLDHGFPLRHGNPSTMLLVLVLDAQSVANPLSRPE